MPICCLVLRFFVRKITLVFMKLEHSDLYRRTQDTNSYAGL